MDFTNPQAILIASSVLFVSGSALRGIGANLSKWQQNREDRHHLKTEYAVDLQSPSLKEYLYVNAQTLLTSISLASFGSLLTKSAVDVAVEILSKYPITYPRTANSTISTPYYHGPVTSEFFPFGFQASQNTTFELLKFLSILINEKVKAKSIVGVTYGAEAVLLPSPTEEKIFPYLKTTSAALAVSSYRVSTFFNNKAQRERDERLHRARSANSSLLSNKAQTRSQSAAEAEDKIESSNSQYSLII
jgi:hypothetical protein